MKYKIEIPEDDITEIVRLHLKGCYEDLKSLYKRDPYLYSKKDLKALKRVHNYYSKPKDFIK